MGQFSRRSFIQMFGLLGISLPFAPIAFADDHSTPALKIITHWYLTPDDWVPNNSQHPVIKFAMAEGISADSGAMTAMLKQAGWVTQWQAPLYSYQHFHSTSHVLLTVLKGRGRMQLGGDRGEIVSLQTGDIYFLPAGTGQRLMNSSGNFEVLAAYPEGQCWDICRSALSQTALKRLSQIPLPSGSSTVFVQLPV